MDSKIRFGDINGDGRDDYLFVYDSGAVNLYLKTQGPDGNIAWVPYGQIATGIPGLDGDGVQFADINGKDGDDYLCVDNLGGVKAYIHQPGTDPVHAIWIS